MSLFLSFFSIYSFVYLIPSFSYPYEPITEHEDQFIPHDLQCSVIYSHEISYQQYTFNIIICSSPSPIIMKCHTRNEKPTCVGENRMHVKDNYSVPELKLLSLYFMISGSDAECRIAASCDAIHITSWCVT
jgi:hypothetical protein